MRCLLPALLVLVSMPAVISGCKGNCTPGDCDPKLVCDGTSCVPRHVVGPIGPGPKPDAAADSGIFPDAAPEAGPLDVGLDDGAIPDISSFAFYDSGFDAGVPDAMRVPVEAVLRVGEYDSVEGTEHLIEGRFFERPGYYSDVVLDYHNGCTLHLNRFLNGSPPVAYQADAITLSGFGATVTLSASVAPGIFVASAAVPANLFASVGATIELTVTPHLGSLHGITVQTIATGPVIPAPMGILSPAVSTPSLHVPQDIDVVWLKRNMDIGVLAELSDANHEVVLSCVGGDFDGHLLVPAAAQGDWLSFGPIPPARLRVGYTSEQSNTLFLNPTGQNAFEEHAHHGASWRVD